jgi:hypothetical protein
MEGTLVLGPQVSVAIAVTVSVGIAVVVAIAVAVAKPYGFDEKNLATWL